MPPTEDETVTSGTNKLATKLDTSRMLGWKTLLAMLVFVDVIWFIHRMAKTYSTAKMILYGCPYYIDCKKSPGG